MAKKPTYEELFLTIQVLLKRVGELEQEVKLLRNKKNSNNSSIPPSKDENRPKRKSLREKSGLKPGRQKGRKGNTLKMVEPPDLIKEYHPGFCTCLWEQLGRYSFCVCREKTGLRHSTYRN